MQRSFRNSGAEAPPSKALAHHGPQATFDRGAPAYRKTVAVLLHGYRHPLLWRRPGRDMLVPYAHASVYLNVGSLHGRCLGSDCVQVGRREWRHSLQRSAARECRESAVEGTADLYGFQGSGDAVATLQAGSPQARFVLSELLNFRTGKRAGIHEHIRGHCGCDDTTNGTARRYCSRDARRAARSGRAGQWRSVHHLTGGQRHALDSDDGSGFIGRDRLHITRCDLPRNTAFPAVADPSHPTTLIRLAEIAPGNFSGHHSVARGQKAWLLRGHCPLTLPAAHLSAIHPAPFDFGGRRGS
jgi:hypothetical protein